MNALRRLLSGLMLIIALVMCWPQLVTLARYRRADATIQAVYLTPEAPGMMRVSVLFDYAPAPDEIHLCWRQADARFRPLPDDPLLPEAEARELSDTFQTTRRVKTQAWFRANDPSGTAFIVSPTVSAGAGRTRYDLGLVLALIGLVGLIVPGVRKT